MSAAKLETPTTQILPASIGARSATSSSRRSSDGYVNGSYDFARHIETKEVESISHEAHRPARAAHRVNSFVIHSGAAWRWSTPACAEQALGPTLGHNAEGISWLPAIDAKDYRHESC